MRFSAKRGSSPDLLHARKPWRLTHNLVFDFGNDPADLVEVASKHVMGEPVEEGLGDVAKDSQQRANIALL